MKLMHPDTDQEIEVDRDAAHRYLGQGWREISDDAPNGNAALADWQDYARRAGFTDDEIDGKTRAELRAALA